MELSSSGKAILRYVEAQVPKNRLTSNEEFNRDGEYMGKLKDLLLRASRRNQIAKTEFSQQVYDRVFSYAKNKSIQLRTKHFGK